MLIAAAAFMAHTALEAAAETTVPVATVDASKKKPSGAVASGIPLEIDLENQRVNLPMDIWETNPDRIMRHEEGFFKELMKQAYSTIVNLRSLFCV